MSIALAKATIYLIVLFFSFYLDIFELDFFFQFEKQFEFIAIHAQIHSFSLCRPRLWCVSCGVWWFCNFSAVSVNAIDCCFVIFFSTMHTLFFYDNITESIYYECICESNSFMHCNHKLYRCVNPSSYFIHSHRRDYYAFCLFLPRACAHSQRLLSVIREAMGTVGISASK